MQDLTVIYLTADKVPSKWAEYQRGVLLDAIGDAPVISFSFKPLNLGINIIQKQYGIRNLYECFLQGSEMSETPYVALAEDDCLYPKGHFAFRPPMDMVAYNFHRWIIFSWGEPFYFLKPQMANSGLIAPRELFIKALKERLAQPDKEGLFKEIGRDDWERKLGLKKVPAMPHYSEPYVCFNHEFSVDAGQVARNKKIGPVKAYDIPIWGKAEDVRKLFI